MFTLTASDHRPGAYGDTRTYQVESLEEGHAIAADLNCGLYSIDDVLYESDGTEVWTYWAADDTTTPHAQHTGAHTTSAYATPVANAARGHVCGDSMAILTRTNRAHRLHFDDVKATASLWTAPRVSAEAFTN